MATDPDARAAARRIVDEVLASREDPTPNDRVDDATVVADVVAEVVDELTDDVGTEEARRLAEEAVADVAGPDVHDVAAMPEEHVSEARARARELVADVLAAREAATAKPADVADVGEPPAHEPTADEATPDALWPADTVADDLPPSETTPDDPPPSDDAPDGPAAEVTSPPESPARLRARELVAAAIAEAEARDVAAREEAEAAVRAEAEAEAARERAAEAERRIEEARRAEEERAAAEQARQQELEQARREEAETARREREAAAERERAEAEERERALAQERERAAQEEQDRALWAEADRDVAGETAVISSEDDADVSSDDVPGVDDGPPPLPEEARTTPLSVAELAAGAQHVDDPDAADSGRADDEALSTAVLAADELAALTAPRATEDPDDAVDADVGSVDASVAESYVDAPADIEPPRDRHHSDIAEQAALGPEPAYEDPRVLEAVVETDVVPEQPSRGGRWLLVSILGAITLAVVFPLAIRALLQLVALS